MRPIGLLILGLYYLAFYLMMCYGQQAQENERAESLICRQRYHTIYYDGKCLRDTVP